MICIFIFADRVSKFCFFFSSNMSNVDYKSKIMNKNVNTKQIHSNKKNHNKIRALSQPIINTNYLFKKPKIKKRIFISKSMNINLLKCNNNNNNNNCIKRHKYTKTHAILSRVPTPPPNKSLFPGNILYIIYVIYVPKNNRIYTDFARNIYVILKCNHLVRNIINAYQISILIFEINIERESLSLQKQRNMDIKLRDKKRESIFILKRDVSRELLIDSDTNESENEL